jgi:hypothetical protein
MQRIAVTGVPIANDFPLRCARRSRYAGESEEPPGRIDLRATDEANRTRDSGVACSAPS